MTNDRPFLTLQLGQTNDWLSRFEKKYAGDPDYVAEGLALDVTEEAIQLMEQQGLNRADLAARMNVSRAYVTQVLNAKPNLTLRSIAQLAIALRATPSVHLGTPVAQVVSELAAILVPSTSVTADLTSANLMMGTALPASFVADTWTMFPVVTGLPAVSENALVNVAVGRSPSPARRAPDGEPEFSLAA